MSILQKQIYLFMAIVLLGAVMLKADEPPIDPMEIDLSVYPGLIRATFDTNKCFWFADVLHLEAPPPEWTDVHKEEIKKYVDDHFQLSVDGKRLDSRVGDIRYSEGLWQPDSLKARLIFTIAYAVPGAGGDRLKGRTTFFQENWAAEKKEAETVHQAMDSRAYETHLHVYGKKPVSLTLTMEKPDFEFSLAAIARSSWQARADAFWDFAKRNLSGPIFFLVIALVIFRYRDRFY